MKTRVVDFAHVLRTGRGWLIFVLLLVSANLRAAQLKEAKVTRVVNEVKLLPGAAAPKPAAINDDVRDGTAVRTGVDSRSELTFSDQTLARLGANTIFSFTEGTRSMDLGGGAMLLRVPKDAGGAKITTAAVTAAITGTTVMMQYDAKGVAKFIVLEGTACLSLKNTPQDCVPVKAGQLLVVPLNPPPTSLSAPIDIDLQKLAETSNLLSSEFGSLASLDLIEQAIRNQAPLKSENSAAATNAGKSSETLFAALSEMTTAVDQRTAVAELTNSGPSILIPPSPTPPPITPTPPPITPTPPPITPTPPPITPTPPPITPTPPPITPTPPRITPTPPPITPTPPPITPTPPPITPTPTPTTPTPPPTTPTPSKFGTPTVINSANLSVIDSATMIQTDPSITRNGETGYGTIYRGQNSDGPAASFLFGSTSSFDTASAFGTGADSANLVPIAVFEFPTLQLSGNPTISSANGGVTKLALIGLNGITTAAPGGSLTFTGLDTLLLATQDGSITLGSEISISGLDRIFIYARGAGRNLQIDSDINTAAAVHLFSEGTVTINGNLATHDFSSFSGGDFLRGAGVITASSLDLHSLGNLDFALDRFSAGTFPSVAVSLFATNSVNLDATNNTTFFSKASSVLVSGETINLLAPNPVMLTFASGSDPIFNAGAGGIQSLNVGFTGPNISLFSAGDIRLYNFDCAGPLSGEIDAAGAFESVSDMTLSDLRAGTSITIGGRIIASTITAGTTIDVAGRLAAFDTVTAGGDITADTIAVPNIFSPTGVLRATGGGITAFVESPGGSAIQHTFTVSSIIAPTGIDFSGNQFDGIDGLLAGGRLTINADTLRFDSANGIGGANFDGADNSGVSNPPPDGTGGDGGIFVVNTTGDIFVGQRISATTGQNADNGPAFGGTGGSVILHSSQGTVEVQDTIQVSSDDDGGTRHSASGGDITLRSGATSGVAINVANTAHLLSYLDSAAPGSGGTISILADTGAGNSSSIEIDNSNGSIEVDRGTLDIRHLGSDGVIDLIYANLRADILKIGALGNNGSLILGGGSISADTLLRLYAGGSNGSIIFTNNITLSSNASAVVLAAHAVTINNGVVVTINGSDPAQVFTDLANYTGSGGNNSTTGTFGGIGATTFPFSNAPPFDGTAGAFLTTYNSLPNGNWSDPASWTPMVVPNDGNGGRNYDVLVNGGRLTQDIASGVTIEQLFMRGGTLVLSNPLSLNQGLQFSGGAINSGTLTIAGVSAQSAPMDATGLVINNNSDYSITFDASNTFSVAASLFSNTGSLRKTNGSGAIVFNAPLSNSGLVSSESGTLRLVVAGSSSGTFSASSNAVLELANNYSFSNGAQFSGLGLIQLDDNTSTSFAGTITNNGNLSLNAMNNVADLTLNGNVTLAGGGTVILEGYDRVLGNGVLTTSNLIQGWSNAGYGLGNDQIGIVVQAGGVIDANVANRTLNVDPNSGQGLVNLGILRASNGGILSLNGNNGGAFTNTGAVITALDGSEVQLVNGAIINGGTLSTAGSGVIRDLTSVTLNGVTLAGSFIGNDNSFTTVSGTLTNTGSISLNAVNNVADLILNGNLTLTGGGVINLEGYDRILGSGILTNVNNVIHGSSNAGYGFGNDQIGIVNQSSGLIDANTSGLVLNVDPSAAQGGLVNQGLLRASNGGILSLNGNNGGAFTNTGATIAALAGSEVQLVNQAIVSGGTLSTTGSGVVRVINTATLNSVTLSGNFIGNDNTFTTVSGPLVNQGSVSLNANNNVADLILSGNVTLSGGGIINLEGYDRILGNGVLTNTDNLIQGWSNTGYGLGNDQIGLVNKSGGIIDANASGRSLNVDPSAAQGGLVNQGLLRASNGGVLYLNGNNGGDFTNTGATISALAGSEVQLVNGAVVNGGTLSAVGSGIVRDLNSATLNGVTLAGAFIGNDNTFTTVSGTLTNTGSISLNSANNVADLILSGNVTLTGGGVIYLISYDRILGNGVLTNVNNVIQGWSNTGYGLGNDQIGIVNQAGGLIDANVANRALNVDPSAAQGGLVNHGLLRASSGGVLYLNGNNGGSFVNTGATIAALDSSEVQLANGVVVSGGNLSASGSGIIRNVNSATLSGVTLNGRFIGNDNTTTSVDSGLVNHGSITLNSVGNVADLVFNGNQSLSGGGTIILQAYDRILGSGILTNSDNLIQGWSYSGYGIGYGQIGIVNQAGGVIDANVFTRSLTIDPDNADGLVNNGLLRARNGGILLLTGAGGGVFNNSSGTIIAADSSEVQLTGNAVINGGILSTSGSGVIHNLDSATLNGVTLGNFIAGNSTSTTVSGTVTSAGSIALNGSGNLSDLVLNGNVTLSGGGTLSLQGYARVLGNGVLTNNNIIQGWSNAGYGLGVNQIGIVNPTGGLIDANVNGLTLDVDPNSANGLTNNGTLRASNGGILLLDGSGGGDFNSSGTIAAISNGVLRFNGNINSSGTVDVGSNSLTATGSYTQSAGSFLLAGGTVQSDNALNFQGGLVDARGSITAAIQNNAILRPALGGSGLSVTGNVSLLSNSQLIFQLGGLTQGTQYGYLNVNGNVSLGGRLVVSFVNNFVAAQGDTFTALSSTGPLSGAFANIASGARLNTSDSSGSFLVSYSGNNLILSNFILAGAHILSTWTGSTGNWSGATNWDTNPRYPNNGQPNAGDLYDAVLSNGGTITLDVPITIQKFTLSSGTVTGPSDLTLNELFTWTGGAMSGSGVTNANGGLVFGNVNLDLFGRTLNLAAGQTATLNSANGYVRFFNGGVINNAGLFLAQNNQSLTLGGGAGNVFNNSGTFTRDTATGTFNSTVPFNNSGVVNIATGTLALSGGDSGSTSGAFNISSGAALNLGGNFTFAANSAVTGAGSVAFGNGTVTVSGSYNLTGATFFNGATVTFNAPITNLGNPLTLNAGAVNFNSNDLTFASVNFSGGSLNGTANITSTGLFTWTGGAMSGSGVTNANGGLVFGNLSVDLFGRTLNLAAGQTVTLNSANGYLRLFSGGVINNAGLFLAQNNQSLTLGGGSGNVFNNTGTFTRDTATGTFTSTVPFNNSGVVNIATGALDLSGGDSGNTSGAFNVLSGAALNFGGNFTLASSSAVTGTGSVAFNNGTVAVSGSYNLTGATFFNGATVTFNAPITNLGNPLTLNAGAVNFNSNDLTFSSVNFSGGSLNGTANITSTGLFTWTGGAMSGSGVTNANGGLVFGNLSVDLFGRTLNLAAGQTAVLNSASGYLRFFNGGVINNAGLFLAQNNQSLTLGGGAGNVFNNSGTFTRDTATGTFNSTVPFNNSGVVNIATGTLALSGGDSGSTSGAFNISSGAVLNLGGNFTFAANSAVTGAGSVAFSNGTVTVSGSYNLTGATLFNGANVTFSSPITSLGNALTISAGAVNFNSNDLTFSTANFSGGSLNGTANITTTGLFTWGGGSMNGSGVTNANGGLLFGNTNLDLFGRTLNLAAGQTATLSSANGYLRLFNGGVINNAGLFLAENDQSLTLGGGSGNAFNNSGTFTRDIGAGTFTSTVPFNNSGVVNVATGTLAFNGGYTQTAGSLNLSGGTLSATSALQLQSGLLTGFGNLNAAITNSGIIRPGLGGALNVNGNVSLLSASQLTFQLGGLTQGTQYGYLNVAGNVSLGGQLVLSFVNGFQNSVSGSNAFTLLNSTALSGSFSNITSGSRLLTSGGEGSFVVNYSGNTLTLSSYLSGAPPMMVGANWLSAASGNWTTPANWSSNPNYPNNGTPPNTFYDAVIAATGAAYTVTLDAPVTVQSWTLNSSNATLSLTNNAVLNTVNTSSIQAGTLLVNGGAVRGGTLNIGANGLLLFVTNSGNRFDGVLVNGDFSLGTNQGVRLQNNAQISGNVTLAGDSSVLALEESSILNTALTVNLDAANSPHLSVEGNNTPTLGANVLVRGAGSIGDQVLFGGTNSLTNLGTITADRSGLGVSIVANTFTNSGTLNASSGGVLNLLSPTWSNTGTINANSSTVNLGGTYTSAGLGTLHNNSGVINITGTLDNTGATYSLPVALTLNGGRILGGTLNIAPNGAPLLFASNGGNRFDGVLVNGNFSLGTGQGVRLQNGAQIAGTVTLSGDNTTLALEESNTLNTALTINLDATNSPHLSVEGNNTPTLGANVLVRGAGAIGEQLIFGGTNSLTNQGTITADRSGLTLSIVSNSFTSSGLLNATSGGILNLAAPTWRNTGTISASNGIVNLGGTFTSAGLGTLQNNNGVFNITGTLDNTGATYGLPVALTLNGGRILGGTLNIAPNGGSLLFASNGGNRFDGVLVNGNFSLGANQGVRLQNGAQIAGIVTLSGDNTALALEESNTLNTALTINLDATNSPHLSIEGSNTPTFGANVVVRGAGAIGEQLIFGGTNSLTNQGTITADRSGLGLSILANTFTNQGTLSATSGGILNLLSPNWSNSGTITANNGIVNFGGSFTGAGLGTVTNTNGTFNITGTFNNTGATYTLPATFTLNGGRIVGGTLNVAPNGSALLFANNSGNRFDGVLINGNLSLGTNQGVRLQNNAQIAGTVSLSGDSSVLAIEESSTLNTALTINLDATNAPHLSVEGNNTPTLGANVVVRGAGSIGDQVLFGGTNSLTNQGTITADRPGLSLNIQPNSFTNQGSLNASGGAILNLLASTWMSSGTITATNATVNLGGTFTSAGLGTLNSNNGVFNITGTLDNTGATYSLPTVLTLNGGRILGGTLNVAPNGSALLFANNSGNRFDGVLINGNLSLGTNQGVRLQNGAQINGSVSLSGDSSVLAIEESNTLTGLTVNMDAANSPHFSVEGNNSATLGASVLVRGAGSIGDQVLFGGTNSLTNQGTITADRSGLTLQILSATFANLGTVQANNSGTLTISSPNWSNPSGTLGVNNGTLNLGGTFTSPGTINRTGGTINITGTWNNTGNTYTLNSTSGDLRLNGGTIRGGQINQSGGALGFSSSFTNLLDGVTTSGTLQLSEASSFVRLGSGTSFSQADLTGSNSHLVIEGTSGTNPAFNTTLSGALINLNASNAVFGLSGNINLTLGASSTVRGQGFIFADQFFSGNGVLINQGTIVADVSGQTLATSVDGLTNQGTMRANAGATLNLNTLTQTAGTLDTTGGTIAGNTLNIQGGTLSGYGLISLQNGISNNATLRPSLGTATGLRVTGSVSLLASSSLVFQLGGLTQGTQYAFLNVNGNVSLGGQLVVSFVNSFQVANANSFTVLSSTVPLTGAFANVASGGRLEASNAAGSFLVTYAGSNITLTDYTPDPPKPARIVPGNSAGESRLLAEQRPAQLRTGQGLSQQVLDEPTVANETPGKGGRMTVIKAENSSQLLSLLEAAPAPRKGRRVNVTATSRLPAAKVNSPSNNPARTANRPALSPAKASAPRSGNESPVTPLRLRD